MKSWRSVASIAARSTRSCVGRIESETAIAGSTRLKGPEKPPEGNHFSVIEKMRTSTTPNQNTGAAWPKAASAEESQPQIERGRSAASEPRMTETVSEIASAAAASSSVFGSASAMRLVTGA